MISPEREAEILRLHHAEKWPVGTIASQLGVHHFLPKPVLPASLQEIFSTAPHCGPEDAADTVAPPLDLEGMRVLVGGYTASAVDFQTDLLDRFPLLVALIATTLQLPAVVLALLLLVPLAATIFLAAGRHPLQLGDERVAAGDRLHEALSAGRAVREEVPLRHPRWLLLAT